MKRMFMTLLIGLWALVGCVNTAVKEAGNVIERTFGLVPSNVKLVLMDRPDSLDTYALSVSDDVLTVEGTSSVALCKGFYDYILSNGYGIASWSGNRLDFPSDLADLKRSVCTSPFSDRLYYNVCTFGYTTPFWGWEQWEKEIDWIALHGFTMPLAPVAGEAILARVWSKLGLTREEIDEYFTGPAHLPWMRMGNMTKVDGGMSEDWHESQIKLQHRINDRMLSLGMTPVYQGFAGFVPKAVKDHYPESEMMTTSWSGHESYMLSPVDSLFSVIGTEFIREWEKEFGKGRYYLIDSFNELDIPFGEKGSQERHDKLQHYSRTIYDALAAANPDAVWVMQGWMFGYQREIWDRHIVEALLAGAPDDKMMIIDLAVDFNNYVWKNGNSWDNLSGFFGKSWIWSTVPNFGGRTALKGPLEFYLNGHLEALASENRGRLTGFGTSPEGVENNEILYELISAAGWSDSHIDLNEFLENYNKARYGASDPAFSTFWKELRESVYCNFTNNARFLWQQRPAYHRCETMNINEHYFKGIESFLSVADKYADNPLYVSDAIQYAALYLAAKADDVLKAANLALVAGDTGKVGQLQEQLSQMLLEMDRLLESHPVYRLQRWFDMADESATDEMESAAFKREIRRLLTVWSGPTLKDYSARVWSGLIRDFYVPRLNFYFDKAKRGEYADMVEYDMLFLDVAEPGELSAVQPFADPLKEACRLVDSYSDIVSGSDCSAGEGVLYWCPQDFVRQGENRIRITVPASEFVRKKGLKFSKLCGDEVKIRKIDFRSGPDTLLVLEPDVLLDRSSEAASIPYGIVDQTRRFEREIYIYITLEGGPQSWGLISLY